MYTSTHIVRVNARSHTHTHTKESNTTNTCLRPSHTSLLFVRILTRNPSDSGRTWPDSLCNPSGSWFYLTWLESHPGHLWNHPRISLNKKRGKNILTDPVRCNLRPPAWSGGLQLRHLGSPFLGKPTPMLTRTLYSLFSLFLINANSASYRLILKLFSVVWPRIWFCLRPGLWKDLRLLQVTVWSWESIPATTDRNAYMGHT